MALIDTAKKLKEIKITFSGINQYLQIYIKSCVTCVIKKPPPTNPKSYIPIDSARPKELVQLD